MSVDAKTERETLEAKDRDELQKIAGALGGKVTSRTRKADIIDQILELTGVAPASSDESDGDDGSSDESGSENGAASPSGTSPSSTSRSGESTSGAAKSGATGGAKGADDDAQESAPAKGASQSKGSDAADAKKSSGGGSQQNDGQQNGGGGGQKGDGQKSDGSNSDAGDADGNDGNGKRRRRRGRNRDAGGQQDEFTGEPIPVAGLLDLRDDGYGFLRVDGLLPSKDDCYVSVKQVRQLGLRKGDLVAGGSRPAFRNEKNPAIVQIDSVNGVELEPGQERPLFEELTAGFATDQIELATDDDLFGRALDTVAPVGKGSRVLLAGAPRTGRTTALQSLAKAVETNEPDVRLLVVLVDERPEEITEMREVVAGGTVYGSAFDAAPDEHVAVVELALAVARRAAESGEDVVVLIDGLTRLARAEHAASQGTGRSLGGLDTAAIGAAKRAFGAGRNLVDAGSVTIVATASTDTLSEVDSAVYEALVGAATTEVHLDWFAAERRAFPAIDLARTATRRPELLVGDDGAEARNTAAAYLAGLPVDGSGEQADGLDRLLIGLRTTATTDDLLAELGKEAS